MKGLNKIVLCGAELCAAIQYYFDNKIFSQNESVGVVTSVKTKDDGSFLGSGYCNIAEVTIEEKTNVESLPLPNEKLYGVK